MSSANDDNKDKNQNDKSIELFKIAVETRQLELQFFWQRSNYFLVLNTAIGVGFFSANSREQYAVVLSLFGLVVSFIWFKMILGGKFWQVRWEAAAERLEREYAPDIKMFAATPDEIAREVKGLLGKWDRSLIQRVTDPWILKKPSPSTLMMCLSLTFMAMWAYLLYPLALEQIRAYLCPQA